MAKTSRSLLDFAIAASLAVLPIMLGVVWLVAVVRPTDPDAALHRTADRYLSLRHLAALKTFEHAIVARPVAMLPGPRQVLEGVPRCRAEWGRGIEARRWAVELIGFGAEGAPARTPADEISAQLAALDAALLRFSSRENPRVGQALGLDAARWFEAASHSLATPIESAQTQGRHLELGCADLAAALAALVRSEGRMLEALTWRGTAGKAVLSRWDADQQMAIGPTQVMRRNPWGGVAGCIFLGRSDSDSSPTHFLAAARSAQRSLCATPGALALVGEPGLADPFDDPRWSVPPSLHAILAPLDGLRQPSQALYRRVSESPGAPGAGHRIVLTGAPVDIGFSVALTIDPSLQALAQKTAACYTGRHDICESLGMRRSEDEGAAKDIGKGRGRSRALGEPMLEGAMVRMAAVAVIDIASGRIEALAGALSPCARQEVDGPGRAANCDRRLPYPVQYRSDALLNPAVFHDAMPASTIKPVMAATFLADPVVGARWLGAERAAMKSGTAPARDSLRGQLMRSDSARFLDRMFCFDTGFKTCQRPWDIQSTALLFGWNGGCDPAHAAAAFDCGKHDLLFGRAIDAVGAAGPGRLPSTPVAYGRLMSEPLAGRIGAPIRLTPLYRLDPGIVQRCASGADGRRGSDDDWEKCRGGAVVDIVAEGWGQGHARASALGVAGMMAMLASAANGAPQVRAPHLVESVWRADGVDASADPALAAWRPADPQPQRLARDAAEVILNGLSYSHRAGTARTACEQVFDARRCRDIAWLAGKTGTPSFPSDGVSLDELARLCAATPKASPAQRPPIVCSSLRPYKWYVAAYRADGSGDGAWTKAIAVLTERNWLARSGQVHGAGDHGPNPSAEIAMQIAGRQVGAMAPGAP